MGTQKSGIASRNPETKRNETEEQPKEDEHQSDRDRPHRRRPRGFDPSPGGRPDEGRLVQFGKELWLKQQVLGAAQSWQMPTWQLPQWQMPTWQMPQWQVPDLGAAKYLGRKLLAV